MAGLADLFGLSDGGMFGGSAGLGDFLTPEMKQQMAFRGLMAAAGAFGQAAMPSRMPIPIGAALGQAGAAMADAQDKGLENALKTALTSGKLQELKSQIAARSAGMQGLDEIAKAMGGLGAPATPSGAPQPLVPAPIAPGADTLGSSSTGGAGGWGPLAKPAVETLSGSGLSPAAVQGIMANGLGEGGFNDPWKKAGGGENSFGHWQFNQGGELPGYLAWAQGKGDPKDTKLQAQFVAQRMEELVPGFSKIDDPKLATDLVATKFERYQGAKPGQRYGYLADVQKAMSGGTVEPRQPIPATPGQLTDEGVLPPVPNFSGAMAGNQGPAYVPPVAATVAFGAPDTVVANPAGGNFNVGRLIMDPSLPNTPAGRAAAAPMSQLSAGYADAVSKGFHGTIQDFAQQQTSPLPAPSAPGAPVGQPGVTPVQAPTPPPGAADASKLQSMLQALALKNAYMGLAGDKQPYNSLISVLQGSPQYKAAIEAATRGAGLPFVGPEAYAKEQGTRSAGIPYDVLLKNLQAKLDRENDAAKQGGQYDAGGVFGPIPGFAETIAGTKGAQAAAEERAKAEQDIVTVPRVDPATGLMTNVRMTRAEAARLLAAQQAPLVTAGPAAPAPAAPAVPAPPGGSAMVPGGAALPIGAEPAGVGQVPPGQQMVVGPDGRPRYENVPGSPQAEAKAEKEKGQAQSINVVTQDIDRALGLSGYLTTGPAGAILQGVPGTAAHDLQQILTGLRANTGFAELNKMRAQSPSGGALGPVSDNENKLLQSTLGSLEQSQSKEQFELNLRRLHNIYLDIVNGSPAQLNDAVKAGKITAAQRDAVLTIPRYELPTIPARPAAAPKTPANADSVRSDAAAAIAKGAPRDAVIKRLQSMGIDPGGL